MAFQQRVPARPDLTDTPPLESAQTAPSRLSIFGAVGEHPVFRCLWLAALASSVGQWMQQVALGWLAIIMTNSPGFVGIVTFFAGLPFLVVAPFGGSLIDRLDRRRLMLACQVLAFFLAMVLAADVIGGFVQPWHLPIAAFFNGSLLALLIPTQQSLVPALVPRKSLTNAIGLMSAGQNMTRVVGPSVAGIVIGTIGVGPTFLAQAAAIAARSFWYWESFCRRELLALPVKPACLTEFGSLPPDQIFAPSSCWYRSRHFLFSPTLAFSTCSLATSCILVHRDWGFSWPYPAVVLWSAHSSWRRQDGQKEPDGCCFR